MFEDLDIIGNEADKFLLPEASNADMILMQISITKHVV